MNSSGQRHLIELPRKVLVGCGVIDELGSFLEGFGYKGKVLIVSGVKVSEKIGPTLDKVLKDSDIDFSWHIVDEANLRNAISIKKCASDQKFSVVIGFGGGKSVDVAKLGAYYANLPFISIPTSASHDGISSPFASIKGLEKPYSHIVRAPVGILADIDLIAEAPKRLLASGCGDLIAKTTAVRDWKLANKVKGEYLAKYAANLALLSADIVMSGSKSIGHGNKESIRDVVEALISAGVAACIAGSSRPCSGSEHLFSHALDILSPNHGLHGEKCGVGTIMMAKLHGLKWENIVDSLKEIGAPTTADEIGLSSEEVVKALLLAPKIRPELYTILNEVNMSHDEAFKLAKSVNVV